MPTNILMPALSPTMEKGNLAKWLKKEGDAIKSGDVIAEIETDKATMEVEAVDEGILARIVVPEGTADVAVNEIIAVIAGEGEDAKSISAPAAAPAPKAEAPKAEAPQAAAAPAPVSQSAVTAAAGLNTGGHSVSGDRPFASPLARRLAKDAGLDIGKVQGSGPHGRIVERDIEAAKQGGAVKAAPAAAPAPAAPKPAAAPLAAGASDEATKKLFEPGSYEEIPHDGMRKTIARRLTEAKQTIPHFYLTVDCELDALLKLRAELNAAAPEKDGKPAYKLSVNDMVIKALALALRDKPQANVSWTEGAMLRHKQVDVGVAVAIPNGLITPIIRDAGHKTLSQISNDIKDLATRAKNRKLKPEEYQGGTTAVSNLGMYGVKEFTAVINPPHSTIIAVSAGEQRAVVKNGALAIATVMSVTLSADHRAVDGALGAELMQAFKGYIEKPMAMLV
ncbi:pyruvate dehydrogenase complex dihydrolipoamide acetyltransferase [Bosea caraganae]|uniref:Acetyltransferase component of pyruvate dehydrogenase complex n=1 Tax=Bosea caraganae TaxID=2763117 RepID=A0A370KZL9_9HYPH|nr:pyruvate dehydrogenase complex dihydrolipoamide acetyltransferase [Bosea caraganae]RDJ20407.1 pyruvate dehydrogenase complex dihydrolipoamide acetyltransferase [Bosea caraganae]RDJ26512.1 pyruvate dehydrogenase complex dihydrolipoamide acetyltransferase [Bosea caraganae]